MFIKITNAVEPIVTGVIYRPHDVKTHIIGDYNVDLLDSEHSQTVNFGNAIISSGFTPLIYQHIHITGKIVRNLVLTIYSQLINLKMWSLVEPS